MAYGVWVCNQIDLILILVKEFDGEQQVKNIYMKEALFWIRFMISH